MIFPIKRKPLNCLVKGAAMFGTWRDKGKRRHAGVDLYCDDKTEVFAMEKGTVINVYDFYSGSKAISIAGTHLIRYGEVTPLVTPGELVEEGQLIARVKRCRGIKQAMLHLEMYSNAADRSSLTQKDRPPYQRRADLINPTEILLKLEAER
jgi:murein DD-endopeptidase MepM/ murein hydrolase activator NlpD